MADHRGIKNPAGNYMATYRLSDGDYWFMFPADDWEDAERKLRAIRTTSVLSGGPVKTYPVNSLTMPFVGAWVIATTFLRNLFRRSA